MNQLAVQRQSRPLLPELPQLFNGFPTFAGLASLRSLFDGNVMRLEDETKDGYYEVRAELPGVDPTDDIEVTVHDGRLTIKAERTQTSESNGHSEFATYDRGILTVTVPLSEDHPTEKRVEVIETILVDEDEDDEDEDDDNEGDDQPELEEAERTEDEEQHQPAG